MKVASSDRLVLELDLVGALHRLGIALLALGLGVGVLERDEFGLLRLGQHHLFFRRLRRSPRLGAMPHGRRDHRDHVPPCRARSPGLLLRS